ncbi:MAG: polyprenyl diphosphate synthase [Bacteriovoracaceae bacterium]|jgi:undecaprenyl diphosphate synthase|nr:polyprenyl diphosphate synthase [Bacteriovoracaceae bacterium]
MSTLKHIAIIMDGNGRWAKRKFRPRIWGHVKGSSIINDIVEEAIDLKIETLTLYAFSSENWSRPKDEVESLMKILVKYLVKNQKMLLDNNIQFGTIGREEKMSKSIKNLVDKTKNITKNNSGLKLIFAFDYGGRNEIVDAVNKIIKLHPSRMITQKDIQENLYRSDMSDVDLVIRTGGDQRTSNFLTWQSVYAELFFTDTMWPDFCANEFRKIVNEVSKRQRRFGSLDNNGSLDKSRDLISKNLGINK